MIGTSGSNHVRRIVHYDAFNECPASTFISNQDIFPLPASLKAEAEKQAGFRACGLWPTASYINHSCIGNVQRSYIGDLLLLRATRHIVAGEELLFNYASCCPGCDTSLAKLRKWGFECHCALCQARRLTSRSVLDQRERALADVKATARLLTPSNLDSRIAHVSNRLQDLIRAMDPLYMPPAAPKRSPLETPFIRLALALDALAGMYDLCVMRTTGGDPRRLARSCIITLVDELRVLGHFVRNGDPRVKDR
jgi:hypothetical protein